MSDWQDKFSGSIWTVQQSVQPDGRIFERVFRAPGSRMLIIRDGKMLLSQEKRSELGGRVDNRLPGGKVFDKNEEYRKFLEDKGDIVEASRLSIAKEALEEVGHVVDPISLTYLGVDVLGATCSWDLHYWVAEEFSEHSQGAQFHESEADEIRGFEWFNFDEVKKIVLDKNLFAETRSAAVILRYLENIKNAS